MLYFILFLTPARRIGLFGIASMGLISPAQSADATAAILTYWQDVALAILFVVAVILLLQVRRLVNYQQNLQNESQAAQQKQQEEYLAKVMTQLKDLDARFQREIDGFAAEASKRSASNEKLLRAQEFAFKKTMEAVQVQIEEISQTMTTMHKVLDSKDAEIARFKQSHDAVVWAKFVRRFVRVHQYIEDLLADNVEGAYLHKIKMRLDGALEECGVESFAPAVGSRYDEQPDGALDDSPEEMPCPAQSDEFKIIEVLQKGYRLSDSGKVIAPAKVKIYAAANPRERVGA